MGKLQERIKAFVVGSAFPVIIFPFMIFGFAHRLHPIDRAHPPLDVIRPLIIENVPMVMPWFFGAWNVVYFLAKDRWGFSNNNMGRRYFITGVIFGVGLSAYGMVIHSIPRTLFLLSGWREYMVIPVMGLLYGFVWLFVVKNLNHMVGLEARPQQAVREGALAPQGTVNVVR